MSWLAAARKRVLEMLASSASALARAELGVEQGQFLGALAHAPLQRFVGALERLGRLHARRDVGEGRDDAAVGHWIGAHLDDQVALGESLEERLGARDITCDALAHERVDRVRAGRAVLGIVAQDFVEPGADSGQLAAAGRESRRTAGSSRPGAGPCRTPRCPAARGRARSAGSRGCSGSPHWRRRAA